LQFISAVPELEIDCNPQAPLIWVGKDLLGYSISKGYTPCWRVYHRREIMPSALCDRCWYTEIYRKCTEIYNRIRKPANTL